MLWWGMEERHGMGDAQSVPGGYGPKDMVLMLEQNRAGPTYLRKPGSKLYVGAFASALAIYQC